MRRTDPSVKNKVMIWVMIIIEVLRGFVNLTPGYSCSLLDMIIWFGLGMAELNVGEGLGVDDAAVVLAQQLTTVGYGSNTPSSDGTSDDHLLQMAHGTSAFFGTLFLDPWWSLLKKAVAKAMGAPGETFADGAYGEDETRFDPEKGIFPLIYLVIFEVLFGIIYTFDLGKGKPEGSDMLTSFYMISMSMTTVGYGDYAPTQPWGQVLAPMMMLLTNTAFDELQSAIADKAKILGAQFPSLCKAWSKKSEAAGCGLIEYMKNKGEWPDKCLTEEEQKKKIEEEA